MNMIKITLPVPTAKDKLASNQTKGEHWSKVSKPRKEARHDGYFLALEALAKYSPVFKKTDRLKLVINVYHKGNIHLDDDNLLTALKPFRDGVFDALKKKFGLNDNQITLTILSTGYRDANNPRVEWALSVRQQELI